MRPNAKLMYERVSAIGRHRADDGTHTRRRTKPAMISKRTGNPRAFQIVLVCTKIETNVRYLGVDIEDALALATGTEV